MFNWKPNPYFTTTTYVSVAGNDLNDGTAQRPFRSLQKCKDAGKTAIQLGTGVYRENIQGLGSIFCEPNVMMDYFNLSLGLGSNIYNLKVINITNYTYCTTNFCFIKGIKFDSRIGYASGSTYNVFKNSGTVTAPLTTGQNIITVVYNSSFDNCYVFFNAFFTTIGSGMIKCIFKDSLISISAILPEPLCSDFNLFYNCQFKFGADPTYKTQAQLEVTYAPSVGIDAVKAYYNAKFGSVNIFNYSKVADPLFNNANLDDYTLQPMSPARHMAYDGSFIGAKDVAFPIYPYANDLSHPNGFYNASKGANLIVNDNKISLARNSDGSSVGGGMITSKPQDLISVYELRTTLPSQQIADRNREWIDTNADIDMSAPIAAGTAITVGESYVVEGGSVTYNSITYATRSKLIVVTGFTAFTTADGGYLLLIKETPNRSTCEMRFKQTITGTVINPSTNLTLNSWYKAVTSVVTWNGLSIPVGDSFQAIAGQLAFTGGGCVELMNDADLWYEIEMGDKPMCKKVGNVITGAIDIGTDGKPLTCGHKEFYTTANIARASQMIQARYIQYQLTFQNKMLK